MKRVKTVEKENEKKNLGNMRRSDILNARGLELFEELRDIRTAIAKEENMPSYIIFADKTLVDMCIKAPLTREEMLKVIGVGENKFERYGERFLDAVLKYTGGVREQFCLEED